MKTARSRFMMSHRIVISYRNSASRKIVTYSIIHFITNILKKENFRFV
ncbi:hypothetical protein CoNPh26_CDS0099 [Staphylococcus phage S-CoN_Ph26]|nr:hypothetical protein CoNPh26_CDS0099 [Staphylococcus phage S-CoN_Ph26]